MKMIVLLMLKKFPQIMIALVLQMKVIFIDFIF